MNRTTSRSVLAAIATACACSAGILPLEMGCTPSARAPLYPVADVLCVVAAEAAGLDEAAAAKACGLAIDVVHDVVGQHNAAKVRLAAPSASPSGGAK